MRKQFLIAVLASIFASVPIFAIAGAGSNFCQNEAHEAGIEDPQELQQYVADCHEQLQQDMEDNNATFEEGIEEIAEEADEDIFEEGVGELVGEADDDTIEEGIEVSSQAFEE